MSEKTSKAQVTIHDERLSLDSIPTFSFSNEGSSNEYKLHLSHPSKDDKVQVTDYQNRDRSDSKDKSGWRLNVSSPQMKKGFHLTLSDRDADSSSLTKSVTLDTGHPVQTIMGNEPYDDASNMYGTHTIHFNRSNDASLYVPNTSPQSYTVDLEWNLSTPISSDVNRG